MTVTISTPSGRSLKRSIALKIVGDNNTASPSTGSPSEDAQNRVEQLLNQHGYNQSSSNIIQNGEKTGGLANRTITYEWTTATGENYILTNVYKQGTADVSWTVTLKAKGVSIEKQGTITSTALELQGNIATWYLALRTIALVGLMSVLVYIGIRIILSSTSSQDKAKYKNMLKDWFVAICILFLLHYAMAFMLEFIGSLNNIIKSNVISEGLDGTTSDKLISTIRNQIGSDLNEAVQSDNVAGKIVMYLALVILTGVFTVQYLKRVIYMAFLTMIAPMIALTYPLDKIKDGKAQAFSYWVREYIFNCLIQPVHLLIYTIFINNAIDFAKENILYAIVALAFMVPAEKFIKEMFGMKSNSPTGTLGAAASGALVMSMLNKVKAKPPKDGADGAGAGASGNANAVRAASNNGGSQPPIPGGSQPPISGGSQPPIPGGGQPPISGGGQAPTQENGQSPISEGGQAPIPGGQTQWTPSIRQKVAQSRVGRAVSRGGQQLIKNQANALKSTGKWVGKTVKALPGAALGATVGLAATVASGGENAGKFIGGGALGGAALSQNLINDSTNGVGDAIKKGWIGTEEYDNRKAKKTFFASEAYRQIKEDPTINQENIRERTATFINNGITDGKVIREAMQNGIEGETYSAFNKEGITSVKDIKALNESGINVEQIKEIKTYSGETDAKKMLRYSAIAKAAKDAGVPNDEESFINWARMHHRMDDGDAKKLFKQVKYYWN